MRVAHVILRVRDLDASVAFYRDHFGFIVEAPYDDPPYATLIRNGVRLSFLGDRELMAPDIALFSVGAGPAVTLAGAVFLVVGVALLRDPER